MVFHPILVADGAFSYECFHVVHSSVTEHAYVSTCTEKKWRENEDHFVSQKKQDFGICSRQKLFSLITSQLLCTLGDHSVHFYLFFWLVDTHFNLFLLVISQLLCIQYISTYFVVKLLCIHGDHSVYFHLFLWLPFYFYVVWASIQFISAYFC